MRLAFLFFYSFFIYCLLFSPKQHHGRITKLTDYMQCAATHCIASVIRFACTCIAEFHEQDARCIASSPSGTDNARSRPCSYLALGADEQAGNKTHSGAEFWTGKTVGPFIRAVDFLIEVVRDLAIRMEHGVLLCGAAAAREMQPTCRIKIGSLWRSARTRSRGEASWTKTHLQEVSLAIVMLVMLPWDGTFPSSHDR